MAERWYKDAVYDAADQYAVDERLGSLGDFAELALQARSSPDSPYRDRYVWSEHAPPDRLRRCD